MAWFLVQSLLFIVLAFLLGVLVGWLIWGRQRRDRRGPAALEPEAVTQVLPTAATAQQRPEPVAAELSSADTVVVHAAEPEPAPEPEPEPVPWDGETIPIRPLEEPTPEPTPTPEPEPEPTPEPEPEPTPEPLSVVDEPDEPVGAAESTQVITPPAPADDLRRIEGIGPRMQGALHDAGILTYRQLADADVPTLRGAIEAAGLRFAPSLATWPRQAGLLADGDEAGFKDLIRRLVAGREVGQQ